jgi:outer membrane lipoprotein-sorting protein
VLSGCLPLWLQAGPVPGTNALLRAWLDAQPSVRTWEAGFVQTRALKSLVHPLVSKGHVWFAAPSQFRWELGDPVQTIAVRQTNQVMIVYPRLRRVERYPLGGETLGPWRDALVLLEAGFPRSLAELESRFHVLALTCSNAACEVTLQPRSASGRRLMPEIRIGFSTNDYALRSTELRFADGSTMRNDFTNAVINPHFGAALFEPVLDADWKITEPGRP